MRDRMDNLLSITTIDDLRYALRMQTSMQRQVALELDDLIKNVITPENKGDEAFIAENMIAREIDILSRYSTRYADLFAATPPLSEHQTHAVNALLQLSSDDFWIKEAHLNRIYGYDVAIKLQAEAMREYMPQSLIDPSKVPTVAEGDINILGIQSQTD